MPDANRPIDVFQIPFVAIAELDVDPSQKVLADRVRHDNATRFRLGLQPRGYVHAITEDVVTFDDHIANVDTHPEAQTIILLRHFGLERHCAAHGVDR